MKTTSEFIAFFEAIPDDKWCKSEFQNDAGQCCARGHLGETAGYVTHDSDDLERLFFRHLGCSAALVNDGEHTASRFHQTTPKARILAALREIEEKEGK
jgi:hypothetical protein